MLDLRDQVEFGQCRYAFVNTAAATETRELDDQWSRNDFVISAALFNLRIHPRLAVVFG